ncbi:MAG: MFS transporter [bacterium]
MTQSRWLRYPLFALLYFVQGAIVAYFTALNALYLISFDLTMSQIGLIGTIGMIPFVLKIFLGMLSDRVNFFKLGHRKPYILIGLVIQSICLIIVPMIDPGKQYWLYAALAFTLMSGQALYDTCTDGLALDTTLPDEQGTVQGFMVGGRALGVVILSAVIGLVVDAFSWRIMFYFLAGMSLLPLPLVFLVREISRTENRKFEWKAFSAFTKFPVISLAALGALYSFTTNGANQIINPFIDFEFGISYSAAGLFTTMWGVGVVLGGLTGGRLVDRIGQRRAVQTAIIISFTAIAALAAIQSTSLAFILVTAFGLAYGYFETVYFALSMKLTDPRIAASMFSILMAIANIGTAISMSVSGSLVDNIGFRITFVVIAVINLLGFLLVRGIFGRLNQGFQPASAK